MVKITICDMSHPALDTGDWTPQVEIHAEFAATGDVFALKGFRTVAHAEAARERLREDLTLEVVQDEEGAWTQVACLADAVC